MGDLVEAQEVSREEPPRQKAKARTSLDRLRDMVRGDRVESQEFSREDRQRYKAKLRTSLDVLREMVADGRFETERKLMGLELELNLVDDAGCAKMINEEVLARIESDDYQTEVAQFNI